LKILFVSSGNSKNGISPLIKNQGESLKSEVEVDYFTIKGKGIKGYLKSIPKLKEYLKNNSYDLIHSHYWLSAIVTSLAMPKIPIVVSLMGDDVKAKRWFRWIIYVFYYLSWSATIVKSKDMYNSLGLKDVYIIPNGVDFNRFKPIPQENAQKVVEWDSSKKHILFTSNPSRVEKNFKLAKEAFEYINDGNYELHYLKDIPNDKIFYYYNASDVIILTSLWEGSPNAIKEAMACNIPIVSTPVGDVEERFEGVEGCYISSFDAKEFALDIKKALNYGKRTNAREKITPLKSEIIAKKLIDIYKKLC